MCEFWYRRVEAVGRYPEPRDSGHMVTMTISHEEPMGGNEDFARHVGMVAEMLASAGFNDDMGDGSSITFHVTYRREWRRD